MKKLLLLLAATVLMLPAFTACSEKKEVQPEQKLDIDNLRADGISIEYAEEDVP